MKVLLPLSAGAMVTLGTRSAWACGRCFGEGGGSALGWILIGAVAFFGYRIFTTRR